MLRKSAKIYIDLELLQVRNLTFGLVVSNKILNMNGGTDYLEEQNMILISLNGNTIQINDQRPMI